MKKIFSVIITILFVASVAMAADVGTFTETLQTIAGSKVKIVRLDCTASGGDIVRTLTSSDALQGAMLMQVNVTPIVAPTAASDLYIYYGGNQKAGGTDFENIVTTTASQTIPGSGNPILWGNWTIDVDNNVVAGARVLIELFFYQL